MNIRENWKEATERDIKYTAHIAFGELLIRDKSIRDVFQGYPMVASGDVQLRRMIPFGRWKLHSVGVDFSGTIGNNETTRAFMSKVQREAVKAFFNP